MSVREEDRRKNSCKSSGLGLAAAAIGVGVGAALYYFFSKRPENPDTEGSTSGNWTREEPQTLNIASSFDKSDYLTISEHTTTDTSIYLTDERNHLSRSQIKPSRSHIKSQRKISFCSESENNSEMDSSAFIIDSSDNSDSLESEIEDDYAVTDTDNMMSNEETSVDSNLTNDSESSCQSEGSINGSIESSQESQSDSDSEEPSDSGEEFHSDTSFLFDSSEENGNDTQRTHSTPRPNMNISYSAFDAFDLDMEWEITSSSADVPTDRNYTMLNSQVFRNIINRFAVMSFSTDKRIQRSTDQDRAFRERRWSLEECSICFDVMLKDEQLMQLPCTHNFHVACIGPWLQEHQTCPMCRKAAE